MKSLATHPTATFIVRMWAEPVNEDQCEWRGQVEHLQTGEKRYFQQLDIVLEFVTSHIGATIGPDVEPN
jgi:hypothetical protein